MSIDYLTFHRFIIISIDSSMVLWRRSSFSIAMWHCSSSSVASRCCCYSSIAMWRCCSSSMAMWRCSSSSMAIRCCCSSSVASARACLIQEDYSSSHLYVYLTKYVHINSENVRTVGSFGENTHLSLYKFDSPRAGRSFCTGENRGDRDLYSGSSELS